jgi:hypothetical protein
MTPAAQNVTEMEPMDAAQAAQTAAPDRSQSEPKRHPPRAAKPNGAKPEAHSPNPQHKRRRRRTEPVFERLDSSPKSAGVAVNAELAIAENMVRRTFERVFPHTARNIYFLISYCHGLLAGATPILDGGWDKDKVEQRAEELGLDTALASGGSDAMLALIEEAIEKNLRDRLEEIAHWDAGLNDLAKQYGLTLGAADTKARYKVEITSPYAMQYLELFRAADQLATKTNVLWIHQVLDKPSRDNGLYVQTKRPLMEVYHMGQDLFVYVSRRYRDLVRR